MKTQEQIEKIQAVVLYILQHFPNGVDYIKLFKIMYFVQRKYLSTYGLCIIEDTFKARVKGPVPALTYKVMKMAENGYELDKCSDLISFVQSVTVDGDQKVYANHQPDVDYIAGMERRVLDEVIAECRDMSSAELLEKSHDAAYKKVCSRMKDDPQKDTITCIDIARAGGASDDVLEYIREIQQIEQVLAS